MNSWDAVRNRVAAAYSDAGRPKRILAAVSGGADSMALLEVLAALRAEEGFFLAAAHIDHGLRPHSGQDAVLTENRCAALQVPCRVCRIQVEAPGEGGARAARYDALFAMAREMEIDAIALAHHRDDQAETLLLHLLRGSGSAGLAAMRPWARREIGENRSVLLWRPVLDTPPAQLRAILEERGIIWAEDESNLDQRFLRNFLRWDVLPRLTERVPEAKANLCRAALILGAEDDFLAEEAARFLSAHACVDPPCRYLMRRPFTALHIAVQRRVLRAFCPFSLDFAETERLRLCNAGETVNLPMGWRGFATNKRLHLLPPVSERAPLGKMVAEPFAGDPGDGRLCEAVPKALLDRCVLRFRMPGDRIHPLGGPGERSLQDFFTDRKVDRPFRDHVPLLCAGNHVVWVIGVGPGEETRTMPEDDAVLLRYTGWLPGCGDLRDDRE